jgi:peptidoglycan/LPS O-acetylase OafA/YrhL
VAGLITYGCLRIQWQADGYVAHMADPTWRATTAVFTYLWFIQQLPCFLFGMLVFKWTSEGGSIGWPRTLVALCLVGLVAIAFVHPPDYVIPYLSRIGLPVQYGFLFALFTLGLMHWQPLALVNLLIGWISKISFSAYLVHLAVLSTVSVPRSNYAEAFVASTAITVAISSLTYICIERPFNTLGGRLAKRLVARREEGGAALPHMVRAPALGE